MATTKRASKVYGAVQEASPLRSSGLPGRAPYWDYSKTQRLTQDQASKLGGGGIGAAIQGALMGGLSPSTIRDASDQSRMVDTPLGQFTADDWQQEALFDLAGTQRTENLAHADRLRGIAGDARSYAEQQASAALDGAGGGYTDPGGFTDPGAVQQAAYTDPGQFQGPQSEFTSPGQAQLGQLSQLDDFGNVPDMDPNAMSGLSNIDSMGDRIPGLVNLLDRYLRGDVQSQDMPGFTASAGLIEDAVRRTNAAGGYNMSGNVANAVGDNLQRHAMEVQQNQIQNMLATLGQYSGAATNAAGLRGDYAQAQAGFNLDRAGEVGDYNLARAGQSNQMSLANAGAQNAFNLDASGQRNAWFQNLSNATNTYNLNRAGNQNEFNLTNAGQTNAATQNRAAMQNDYALQRAGQANDFNLGQSQLRLGGAASDIYADLMAQASQLQAQQYDQYGNVIGYSSELQGGVV